VADRAADLRVVRTARDLAADLADPHRHAVLRISSTGLRPVFFKSSTGQRPVPL